MADTYVPFGQPVEYISNDIQQYVPGEIYNPNSKTEYSHMINHHITCFVDMVMDGDIVNMDVVILIQYPLVMVFSY